MEENKTFNENKLKSNFGNIISNQNSEAEESNGNDSCIVSLSSENDMTTKEGYLMKQTRSFHRWHQRYFKLKGQKLLYAKNDKADIFHEISLADVTLAESSSSTYKHSFQVITPFRTLMLAAETRTVMNEWFHVIRAATDVHYYESQTGDHSNFLSGSHVWYATSHARPTYCNICREQLCGVTSQGLSCEICKFKAHKRCAGKALNYCKWTTLASMGKEIIEEADGTLSLPHQWLEGNLPVSSKCDVCERTCGSVLRLQDWRCLWCRVCVHSACRPIISQKCPVGRISIVPPTALHTIGNDDAWETPPLLSGCSPLLVFVNSKSGDHQGLKFLRRFRQLLNPAQVFDLMPSGPRRGLEFFRHFEPFRILVCGGDGSVGWVMSEIDKLSMHRQCQVGVLPLGTGNDLARVLGWGSSCDDDTNLPHILEKYEKATTKMLDRWSVMIFERGVLLKPTLSQVERLKPEISEYEVSVVSHLQNILQSHHHQTVITSAKVLCETVRDMIGKIGTSSLDSEIDEKCKTLSQKLDSLLQTLHEETDNTSYEENINEPSTSESVVDAQIQTLPDKKLSRFRQRDALMLRANSLKKAVRQIIEHAEKTIDEQTTAPPIVVVRPLSFVEKQEENVSEFSTFGDKSMSNNIKLGQMNEISKLEEGLTEVGEALNKLHLTKNSVEEAGDEVDSSSYKSHFQSKIYVKKSEISPAKLEFLHNFPLSPLPVPKEFSDEFFLRRLSGGDEIESKAQKDIIQSEKEINFSPPPFQFEIESPSSSSETRSPVKELNNLNFKKESNCLLSLNPSLLLPNSPSSSSFSSNSPGLLSPNSAYGSGSSSPSSPQNFPRGTSPRASRRVSMGSLFKPLGVEIPPSPEWSQDHKKNRRKKLPIVNPLISHPSWPAIASGGIVSKVLLANADAICAVASPLMDPEDDEGLMLGFNEKCVLNNYFGIGIDAKITLDFHLKREEHPEKCQSRTKNFMWYGVLGSKEYLQQSCKNLEQRVQLECDGKRLSLPCLQGIVILNIQSFMGGTNFWGGTKEDDCFLAPSFDDRILEVVAVFDSMQMAASRLINLQHHRIAQCHSIKVTIIGDDPIPVQVDGEAWLQPPGVIKIIHKNRMQMLCRNRALESSLKSWEEKQRLNHPVGISPSTTENDELDKKRYHKRYFFGKLRKERKLSETVMPDGGSDGFSDETSSMENRYVDKWTLSEVGEWLDSIELGEYKYNFVRHDIQGAELLSLQRRDLKDLGITKVGHIKRILQGIKKLHREKSN